MLNRLNYSVEPIENAPLPIKQGAFYYSIPNDSIKMLSVVYDINDISKTPRVVVGMPCWTHAYRSGGIEELRFYKGVNVVDLHGGHGNDNLPIERYALLENPPTIPKDTLDWFAYDDWSW